MYLQIAWQPNFETGITVVDTQHRMLVEMINQIESADATGLQKIVNDLADYASLHFDTEEILMLQYAFPGAKAHATEHEKFSRQVAHLLAEKELAVVTDKTNLFSFLKSWLINHIQVSDQEMAKFIKTAQIG